MAEDWIKMGTRLAEKPEVIGIAERLSAQLLGGIRIDEDTVVGKLHRLWSWADANTVDGNARGVTRIWVDRYLKVEGFGQAMADVGWLLVNPDGITFPNFHRHNGQTAKTRALTAKRVAKFKAEHGNDRVTLDALPREEKNRSNKKTAAPSRGPVKKKTSAEQMMDRIQPAPAGVVHA